METKLMALFGELLHWNVESFVCPDKFMNQQTDQRNSEHFWPAAAE